MIRATLWALAAVLLSAVSAVAQVGQIAVAVQPAPSGGGQPWTLVASTEQPATGASTVTTGAVNMSSANTLIVAVSYYSARGTVTDSSGNTYSVAVDGGLGAGNNSCAIFYKLGASVSSSMTFTYTGSGYSPILVEGWKSSGGSGVGALDQTNSAVSTGQWPMSAGSVTPTANNELIFSAVEGASSSGSPTVPGLTVDQVQQFVAGNSYSGADGYLAQTTVAAVDPSWSWPSTSMNCAAVATFKPHS